jgi:hypothetical protein
LVVALGLWMLSRSASRALGFAAAGCVGVVPIVLIYQAIYATPFGPSQAQMAGREWQTAWFEPLAGLLVSPARGLLVYQPWVLIAVGGVGLAWRKSWWWLAMLAAIAHILLIASWKCWWGGWCWGSRLLSEAVPLLALAALPGIEWLLARHGGWVLLGILGVSSFAVHAAGVWAPELSKPWVIEESRTMWLAPTWSAMW